MMGTSTTTGDASVTDAGDLNPNPQLDAIKAKDFGKYVDPKLGTVPVNYLATLDITGATTIDNAIIYDVNNNNEGVIMGTIGYDYTFTDKCSASANADSVFASAETPPSDQ